MALVVRFPRQLSLQLRRLKPRRSAGQKFPQAFRPESIEWSLFENAYVQWTDGVLDTKQWEGMKRMLTDYGHIPSFREYWQNRKHWYSDDFQYFMDTEILPSDAKDGVPLPGQV